MIIRREKRRAVEEQEKRARAAAWEAGRPAARAAMAAAEKAPQAAAPAIEKVPQAHAGASSPRAAAPPAVVTAWFKRVAAPGYLQSRVAMRAAFVGPAIGVEGAWSLLKEGRIADGRAALAGPMLPELAVDAAALAALESRRPPTDAALAKDAIGRLERLAPEGAELHSLMTIAMAISGSPAVIWEHYQKAVALVPRGNVGGFLQGLAELCASDVAIQWSLGGGRWLDKALLQHVVKGATWLILRKHAEALASFAQGFNAPDEILDAYEGLFASKISAENRAVLVSMLRRLSVLGAGLVFTDLGLDEDAKAAATLLREMVAAAEGRGSL